MFNSLVKARRATYHQTTGHRNGESVKSGKSGESGLDGSSGGDAGVGGMSTTDADVQLRSEGSQHHG